ncbi:NADH-quinone oxidoreductase subunit J [Luteimonas dalianensis]|uniref:NADH-quinone oxidoreductase subunit J n=1 Tax=Luteimonas dalianensis TaxID=1148196 RepID=UPI003BF3146D
MDFVLPAFYVFAAIAVMAAVAVISVRNPVHSVLFLVLTFFSVACTWIIAGAEFLGLALILVYVGAIMVLFLFVVMMLEVDIAAVRDGYVRYLPVGLLVAVVMLVQILTVIGVRARSTPYEALPGMAEEMNTAWVAYTLFTDYLLPFEIAALILTVAVIAAVVLTLRNREGTKRQNPGEQSRTTAGERLRMVKMQAEATRSTRDVPADGQAPAGEGKP